jgi:hypothetical protein
LSLFIFFYNNLNLNKMAGKNMAKSTAPGYGKAPASTKGVKVGLNDSNVKLNVPSMKKGGMVGKTASLAKAKKSGSMIKGKK